MNHRVIIAGGRQVGERTAALLEDYGHDTVVVAADADRCDRITDRTSGVVIEGDPASGEVLAQAGIDRSDVFVALTGDSERNRTLCRRVDAVAGDVRTVSRVDGTDPPDGPDTGPPDATVVPETAAAKATANAVLGYGHDVHDVPTSGFDLLEVDVDPAAPAAREDLATVAFPDGCQVVADARSRSVAGPGTELRPGRRYVVAVERGAAEDVRYLLRG